MANVMFKRGTQAQLNALDSTKIVDGSFYLTTDTNRLYVGKQQTATSTNVLVELNQSINIVSTMGQLPTNTTEKDYGQFYYVSSQNILCVYVTDTDGKGTDGWMQINPDTALSNDDAVITLSAAAADGATSKAAGAAVKLEIEDTKGNKATGNFTIRGSKNVTVTQDGSSKEITISVADAVDYSGSLGTVASSESGILRLVQNGVNDDVTIKGEGTTTVTSDANGNITISSSELELTNSLSFSNAGVLTSNVNGETSSVTPKVTVGKETKNQSTKTFDSGTVVLDVYTTGEVDSLISSGLAAADAMTYKGTVSSTDASSKILSTANVGDTYKAADDISITVGGTSVVAKTGDLIIAKGTDGNVTWDVIPSGDDQIISGRKVTHGIVIQDDADDLGGIQLTTADNSGITLTDTDTTGVTRTVQIAHAAYTAQSWTGSTVTMTGAGTTDDETKTAKVVTAISRDALGHIGSVTVSDLVLKDTHNRLNAVHTDTKNITVTGGTGVATTITVLSEDGNVDKDLNFKSTSLNLTQTTSSNVGSISIDLIWGSFTD